VSSAMCRMVAGSWTAAGASFKSPNSCCSRPAGTICNWEDWPTSVLRISAKFVLSQSSDGSPEPFRKGRMASETGAASHLKVGER